MEEEDRGVVCDDCGSFIREGPPSTSEEFPGLTFYIRGLCEDCAPHHECPELDEARRKWLEEQRAYLRRLGHPGQQEMDFD